MQSQMFVVCRIIQQYQ